MSRITLAELSAPEVELPGGHVYTVTPATRAVITKGVELDKQLDAVGDEDLDGIVDVLATIAGIRLKSVATGQPKAETILKRLWKEDKITIEQLNGLLTEISATDRPTSAQRTT